MVRLHRLAILIFLVALLPGCSPSAKPRFIPPAVTVGVPAVQAEEAVPPGLTPRPVLPAPEVRSFLPFLTSSTALPTGPFSDPNAVLLNGPILQAAMPTSIEVSWRTDLPSLGNLLYWENAGIQQLVSDEVVTTTHRLILTGLAPYTLYTYRVLNGGLPLSEEYTFRSAAPPDQSQFHFVVFGDTRTNYDNHVAVVNRIVALQPDFAIHTGDLVESGLAPLHWKSFLSAEKPLLARIPLYPVLGNHDLNGPIYFDLFNLPGNEHYYSFDYGTARFVILQLDGTQAAADLHDEQLAWLENTLSTNTQPWLFIFMHIPLYPALGDPPNPADDQWITLFERYRVNIVFAGHEHDYQRRMWNNITYIITGGGGGPLYEPRPATFPPLAAAKIYHAVDLHIDGRTLTSVAVQYDGLQFDPFTLTLP